jgi:hypothetical protein
MRPIGVLFLFCVLLGRIGISAAQGVIPISAEGQRLRAALDAMDVEHLWLPGEHIDWRTGMPDGKRVEAGPHTHCSAFLAAFCVKQSIPILLPPPQKHLANRQQDWLLAEGAKQGWLEVNAVKAQELANQGRVVVASWKNSEKDGYHRGAGHMAIVRPEALPRSVIHERGPQITQAGGQNYNSNTVAYAFRGRAWQKHEVRYFAYMRNSS